MYFVVMPRVNLIVILMMYVRYLYSINCPTVICLPSMLLFILWRDTTSELWTPVLFPLYCYTVLLLFALFTFLHTIILLPLDTLNPLFTTNWWDWQPHRKLGAKFLVVLCIGFTLLLVKSYTPTSSLSGALVRSVMKLASITFWGLAFSYWFDSTLVSQPREDFLLWLSYLPLGVANELYLQAIIYLGLRVHSSS
jgi:hypothetical protein